ncbi:hypothetical protein EDB19DRAFT_1727247 [Suillus lakei]|nr:hypothetical protein EDB19DRAFT_1727247 [Suillus lakei]
MRCSSGFCGIGVDCSESLILWKSLLDHATITAFSCTGLVILLTVHARDLANINGDRRSQVRTANSIIMLERSRIYMHCAVPLISFAPALLWSLGPLQHFLWLYRFWRRTPLLSCPRREVNSICVMFVFLIRITPPMT